MDDQTLEIVTFKSVAGATPEAVIAAGQGIIPWLKNQPGFISRHMGQDKEGHWVDCVRWQSHGHALAAAGAMMEAPGASAFMHVIEPSSIVMRHYHLAFAA